MNPEKLWQDILDKSLDGVSGNDPKSVFLSLVKPLGIFGNQFILITDNEQVEVWVNSNYLNELQTILNNISDIELHINITTNKYANDLPQNYVASNTVPNNMPNNPPINIPSNTANNTLNNAFDATTNTADTTNTPNITNIPSTHNAPNISNISNTSNAMTTNISNAGSNSVPGNFSDNIQNNTSSNVFNNDTYNTFQNKEYSSSAPYLENSANINTDTNINGEHHSQMQSLNQSQSFINREQQQGQQQEQQYQQTQKTQEVQQQQIQQMQQQIEPTLQHYPQQEDKEQTNQPTWMNEYVNLGDLQTSKTKEEKNFPKAESIIQRGVLYDNQSKNKGHEIFFEKYTFDNFIVGESNRFARGIALNVAEQPGVVHNPAFIYGNPGLGKTHLLAAIGNYILKHYPKMSVIYTSANDFINEFIHASTTNSWLGFNKKYHQTDVLLFDDIQFLDGKKETTKYFFDVLNNLSNQNKQIVLSADRAPKDINMNMRMLTRFVKKGIANISPPDYETRLAILKSYLLIATPSSFTGVINNDILEYIASNPISNVREIEGALNQVIAHMSIFHKDSITPDEAKDILQDFFLQQGDKQITIENIQEEVSRYFGISHDDLISSKRSRNIAQARHIAIYLSRWNTEESLESIGKKFGGRDHTTVMHSVNKIDKDQKDNRKLFEQIEHLTATIKSRS